jgi:hypothetical protein
VFAESLSGVENEYNRSVNENLVKTFVGVALALVLPSVAPSWQGERRQQWC